MATIGVDGDKPVSRDL